MHEARRVQGSNADAAPVAPAVEFELVQSTDPYVGQKITGIIAQFQQVFAEQIRPAPSRTAPRRIDRGRKIAAVAAANRPGRRRTGLRRTLRPAPARKPRAAGALRRRSIRLFLMAVQSNRSLRHDDAWRSRGLSARAAAASSAASISLASSSLNSRYSCASVACDAALNDPDTGGALPPRRRDRCKSIENRRCTPRNPRSPLGDRENDRSRLSMLDPNQTPSRKARRIVRIEVRSVIMLSTLPFR